MAFTTPLHFRVLWVLRDRPHFPSIVIIAEDCWVKRLFSHFQSVPSKPVAEAPSKPVAGLVAAWVRPLTALAAGAPSVPLEWFERPPDAADLRFTSEGEFAPAVLV